MRITNQDIIDGFRRIPWIKKSIAEAKKEIKMFQQRLELDEELLDLCESAWEVVDGMAIDYDSGYMEASDVRKTRRSARIDKHGLKWRLKIWNDKYEWRFGSMYKTKKTAMYAAAIWIVHGREPGEDR